MGFLSAWEDNERIDVSDLVGDEPGTWWVDVKKCLTHGEADAVMRQLMAATVKMGAPSDQGKVPVTTSLSVDAVVDHQGYLVAKSIVGWNLTDAYGDLLPVTPFEALEHSLAILPSPVYDRVAKAVVAANTEDKGETAQFPSDGGSGDPIGQDLTPDGLEVLL